MDATESVNHAPEECAWCRGTRKKSREGERCQVCKGRGAVLVGQPARACIPCRGSGHEGGFSDQPMCPVCGGSGGRGVYQARAWLSGRAAGGGGRGGEASVGRALDSRFGRRLISIARRRSISEYKDIDGSK